MYLLKLMIINDALGLDKLNSSINYARGEVIHCNTYDIKSIKVYQYVDYKLRVINWLANVFDLDYREFGIKKN
jgi:hypothetical protein